MSNPESVSSRIEILGSRVAICKISTLFFSPPEKPSLRYLPANDSSMSRRAIFSFNFFLKSGIEMPLSSGFCPFRWALMAVRKKLATDTPGTATGY